MPDNTLRDDLTAVFGDRPGAVADAARALEINYDNLRKMLAGKRGVPPRLSLRLAEMRALAHVTPPPETLLRDADRDGPCGDALDPHLDALRRRAEAAGWHPAEVCAAVLSWAVHRVVDGAGPAGARQMLDDAAELITLRG